TAEVSRNKRLSYSGILAKLEYARPLRPAHLAIQSSTLRPCQVQAGVSLRRIRARPDRWRRLPVGIDHRRYDVRCRARDQGPERGGHECPDAAGAAAAAERGD